MVIYVEHISYIQISRLVSLFTNDSSGDAQTRREMFSYPIMTLVINI